MARRILRPDHPGALVIVGDTIPSLIASRKGGANEHRHAGGDIKATVGTRIGPSATRYSVNDFTKDIKPYIESHYRVRKGRANTAIAGLSMGGSQTLNVAVPNLEQYTFVGVYSSGLIWWIPQREHPSSGSTTRPCGARRAASPHGPDGRGMACDPRGEARRPGAEEGTPALVRHGQGRLPARPRPRRPSTFSSSRGYRPCFARPTARTRG